MGATRIWAIFRRTILTPVLIYFFFRNQLGEETAIKLAIVAWFITLRFETVVEMLVIANKKIETLKGE